MSNVVCTCSHEVPKRNNVCVGAFFSVGQVKGVALIGCVCRQEAQRSAESSNKSDAALEGERSTDTTY